MELTPGRATLRSGPRPEVPAGWARIEVLACGICGTDVHMLRGMQLPDGAQYPLRPGHEVAGRIVEFGPDVEDGGLALGDLVVLHTLDSCGHCPDCRTGADQRCATARVLGMHHPGGLAEEVVWPVARLVRANGLEPGAAAVLADSGATAYHAVRVAQLPDEPLVCVLGAGGVGTQVLNIVRAMYPGAQLAAVVGSRPSAERLADSGAIVEVGVGGVGRRLRREMGEFDAVFEFSGSPEAPAEGVRLLRRGGRLVLGSVVAQPLDLGPSMRVQTRELELVGVFSSSLADLQAVTDMCLSGLLPTEGSVSHRRPLSRAVEALDAVATGVPGLVRMVIERD